MKKTLLCLLALVIGAVAYSCDDDDETVVIDEGFYNALFAKYPGATDVSWQRHGAWYIAEFNQDNHETEAWFDADGKWLQSETEYGKSLAGLPDAVVQAFAVSEYSEWTVDDVSLYERPEMSFYVINIEKVGARDLDVFYLPDGTLIQAIPEVVDITPSTPIPAA